MAQEKWIFGVEGMTCQGCVQKITDQLKEVNSEMEVNVDLDSKTVTAQGENLSPMEAKAKIQEAGFQVTKMSQG